MSRLRYYVTVLVCMAAGCGGQAAEHKTQTPADAVAAASEPAPAPEPSDDVNQLPQTDIEASESGAEYVVRGVCPFECCKYGGTWTIMQGGILRSEPSRTADSVGSVQNGAAVHTDEGVMVLHPPGVAVVIPDTSTHNSSGPTVGDTVDVITYMRAKVGHVRWHDQEFEMSWSALQMVREPLQRWWVHMTDPITGNGGWLQMGGVNQQDVGAPNSCSKPK